MVNRHKIYRGFVQPEFFLIVLQQLKTNGSIKLTELIRR